MKLCRLTYFSQNVGHSPSAQWVDELAVSAGRRNAVQGITGVLAASNDSFLQVLEGRRGALARLMEVITNDVRHLHVTIADFHEIETRLFPAWAMTAARATTPEHEFTFDELVDSSHQEMMLKLQGRVISPDVGAFAPIDMNADTLQI